MRFENDYTSFYRFNLLRTVRNDWKLHLGMKNSVWRRLRRAKRGIVGKNKILEGYLGQTKYLWCVCGFEKSIYTLSRTRHSKSD